VNSLAHEKRELDMRIRVLGISNFRMDRRKREGGESFSESLIWKNGKGACDGGAGRAPI